MRKSSLLLAAGVVALAASAPAQLDFEVLFDRVDTETARADVNGNAEFDGVAVSADGSVVYTFDSDGGIDGLWRYDVANDTGAVGAGLTVITYDSGFVGTPPATAAAYGAGASAAGIDATADGTLYQIVRTTTQKLLRINQSGSPVVIDEMVPESDMVGAESLVVDEGRGLLWYSTNDTFNNGNPENIYSVDITATGGSGSRVLRVSETVLNAVVIPTPSIGGSQAIGEIEIFDMTLHPDGDLLVSMGFNESNLGDGLRVPIIDAVGCIIKCTPDMGAGGGNGSATLWMSRAQVLAPFEAGGTPRSFPAVAQLALATTAEGRILICNNAFSGDLDQYLTWASADASVHRLIADNTIFRADADIDDAADLGTGDLRGIAVDASGDIYLANQNYLFVPSFDVMVKVTGVDYELTNVNDWMNF